MKSSSTAVNMESQVMLKALLNSAMLALLCMGLLAAPAQAEPKKKPPAKTKASSGPQKLYKWVDEDGTVHYSERMTEENAGRAVTTINRQGAVVKETDRALTKEELAAKQVAEREKQDAAKRAMIERRKNEAVLSSYESEKGIELARSRALESNADAIKSAAHNVDTATKKNAELQQRAAAFKDKPVPSKLQQEIEGNETDLKNQQQLLDSKKREAEQINARYDEDKRRFNTLTKGSTADTRQLPSGAALKP
jgi:hypothetical protein